MPYDPEVQKAYRRRVRAKVLAYEEFQRALEAEVQLLLHAALDKATDYRVLEGRASVLARLLVVAGRSDLLEALRRGLPDKVRPALDLALRALQHTRDSGSPSR